MTQNILSISFLDSGCPWPLGATFDGHGINFAVFSAHAEQIQLCIFDETGRKELARISLPEYTDQIWHGYLPGGQPGLVYGYRAFGPNDPDRGHRFNPHKLLIDPYAKQLAGLFHWSPAHFGFEPNAAEQPELLNKQDNARETYKAVVFHDAFDWGDDQPPATPLADSVLYETHVKGFTMRHPGVPEALRGTYAGFASDTAIAHLKRLGVTAVSLLPVHQSIPEQRLVERGLTNYWGYNTIGFFVPDRRFANEDPVLEFKFMVKRLHAAGIEVILDVVYNHTAESDHTGPTLSLRGLDNTTYYHLRTGHPRFYENFTGTGNSVNLQHPRVLQWVMDSLRYWVTEMRVDGFRFDLAVTLARGKTGYEAHCGFLDCLRQDPILSRVKLIAEPWDIGIDGYQLGRFPPGWSEWNDRFRDASRAFWVRQTGYLGEFAARITGSSDLFKHAGRQPQASVNYITAHDGFTLHDLLSYNAKHNKANGEDDRDGSSDNKSWNCGTEGPTKLLAINALRTRLKRTLLATLFISQGIPMLLAGDELSHTQLGNNNAYCQDNSASWLPWDEADESLIAFVAEMIALRNHYPQLRATHWLRTDPEASGGKDITWLSPDGVEMTRERWEESSERVLGMFLPARKPGTLDILVVMNAEASDWSFSLPNGKWRVVLDTGRYPEKPIDAIEVAFSLKSRTLALLESVDVLTSQ